MELIGKWTGVCYYESTRPFVLDSTMKLSIILSDDGGNLRGTVTEICELHAFSKTKATVEENVFSLEGKYDEKEKTIRFIGECTKKDHRMKNCALNLTLTEEEEKLTGVFSDTQREDDVQRVELYKGEIRRDLKELDELGIQFLEKIRKQERR